jgi:hypothetical protein
MVWCDKSSYKGYWKNGVQDGVGIMRFPDKQIKIGLFQNNVWLKEIKTAYEVSIPNVGFRLEVEQLLNVMPIKGPKPLVFAPRTPI